MPLTRSRPHWWGEGRWRASVPPRLDPASPVPQKEGRRAATRSETARHLWDRSCPSPHRARSWLPLLSLIGYVAWAWLLSQIHPSTIVVASKKMSYRVTLESVILLDALDSLHSTLSSSPARTGSATKGTEKATCMGTGGCGSMEKVERRRKRRVEMVA